MNVDNDALIPTRIRRIRGPSEDRRRTVERPMDRRSTGGILWKPSGIRIENSSASEIILDALKDAFQRVGALPLFRHRSSEMNHAFLFILSFFLGSNEIVHAIESKCSACQAVAHELSLRMEKELPRNALDMRHRLDAQGQRYGPVIDYKRSELRALELMEGLCDSMHQYVLQRGEKKEDVDDETQSKWTKESKSKIGMSTAEKKDHGRRLFNYCASLMEEFEEDISKQIRKDLPHTGVEDAICRSLSMSCSKVLEVEKDEL